MNDVTPLSAIQSLTQISRELDHASENLAEWERKAVRAREDFTLAFATQYLAAEGSVETRKAIATRNTHAERFAAEAAEAEVRIWRNKIRVLERRIDVGRSVVGVLRVEAETAR